MSKQKDQNRFVIIDGHAIIHRAYHALPPMTVKDGTIVNAVFGFTSMLLKVLSDLKPTHIAVSFDMPGGTFRDEIYEDYKATREKADQDLYDQIPLVYDVVEAFNIPIYEKEGFEADDVIGTIAETIKGLNNHTTKVTIVTGDKDILQLVDDKGDVEVALMGRGVSDFAIYDEAAVQEKFGFGPDMVVDFKGLMGDPSDNIPGVKGVGKKTATTLIQEIGDLETIYKELDSLIDRGIKKGMVEKLRNDEDNARMSVELATILRDVKGLGFKLKDAEAHDFDKQEVKALFQKYEFFSLIRRVPGLDDGKDQAAKKVESVDADRIQEKTFDTWFKKIKILDHFLAKEIVTGVLPGGAFDGLIIGQKEKLAVVEKKNVSEKQWTSLLELFGDKKKTLIGHDVKQLVKALMQEGMTVKNKMFDVMIASYIVNSSTRSHDLRSVVIRELGIDLPEEKKQGNLFEQETVSIPAGIEHCEELFTHFEKALKKDTQEDLFYEMEMALIPVLAEMELHGIVLDTKKLSAMSKKIHARIEELTRQIHKEAGKEFNIASSTQLREVLFEKMKLPTDGIKKGKTGYSTAASELDKLREHHSIIELIEEYREITKLQNTYVDVLPTLINEKTGRIHTSFNQAVAQTGRLSSSDPNLQNIPVRTEMGQKIRDAFVAEKGYSLVAADYSQIELRVVASLAKDKELMGIFERGEDVHTATAAAMNNVELKDVTKTMRNAAKGINFGILYGMGAYGLSWRTKIPQWQAKEFIDKYFEAFSGVQTFLEKTLKDAKKKGYVETIFGRRRYIPELSSANYQMRAAGERMAINMPVQGAAAEIMKLAMIEVAKELKKQFSNDDARMLLQVHDELVLEVKNGLEKKVETVLTQAMEGVVELAVPVVVEAHSGKHWGELK